MPQNRREMLASLVSGEPASGDAASGDAASRDAGGGAGCISQSPAPTPDLASHAADRIMFGPKPGDVAQIRSLGYDAWIAQQINYENITDRDCELLLDSRPSNTLSETWQQLYDRRNGSNYNNITILPIRQIRERTWLAQINSRRQLFERMVDFWHNHFNVHGFDFLVRSMFPKWDAIMRQHAFGNFRTLLEATTANPVMLYYLDNYINTNAGTNENYARESFELHTMGAMHYRVPGGYVDDDVYEASRCFTGWTYEQSGSSPDRGTFKYVEASHDRFQKVVLGNQIPRDQPPQVDGKQVLDFMAFNIATARHIAYKLCVRFISDNPAPSIVESTAQVFFFHRFAPDQIKQTLIHLLNSAEFKDPAIRMAKLKRPQDWTVSLYRALAMTWPPVYQDPVTRDLYPNELHQGVYDQMGQPMFGWRPPDGPPDTFSEWATSNGLLRRWNYITSISGGDYYPDRGLDFPWQGVMPGALNTAEQIVDWWVARIFQRTISEASRTALCEFLAEGRNWTQPLPPQQITDKLKHVISLMVMTPEFMRR